MACRPPDWIPRWFESALYVSPAGDRTRNATVLRRDISPGHHLVSIDRRIFEADTRDIYPLPNWREQNAHEDAEDAADRAWDEENAESLF